MVWIFTSIEIPSLKKHETRSNSKCLDFQKPNRIYKQ